MRTLIYCTAYARTLPNWTQRCRLWLDAVKQLDFVDQILIVDDGSPVLPGWPDLHISSGPTVEDAAPPTGRDQAILHHFTDRLGRSDVFDCPGWYRSYGFGVAYAVHHGFDRVIHVESDAFLLSERVRDYARNFHEGWAALWCERYQFPELAVQIAANDGVKAMFDYTRHSYDGLVGRVHETLVPFTHVERGLVGDRFGETYEPIPRDADYVCQIHPQREAPYYWWLPSGTHYGPDALDEQNALAFHFRYGGNSEDVVGEGWSHAEGDFRWMTGYASTLHLPPLPHSGDYALRINVHPMLYGALNLQRLGVLLNGRPIQDFEIVGDMIVGTMLSAHDLRRDGSDQLTLVHPDSLTPAALTGWSVDMRILSMALRQLTLVPVHA